MMLRCKRCSGFMYEEEVFYEADSIKKIQLGCYSCPHKVYVEYSKWIKFKKQLGDALAKSDSKDK